MSVFNIELEESAIHNFTLKKFFTKVVKAYRSGSVEVESTPLGKSYRLDGSSLGLDQRFAKDPTPRDMRSKNINSLYSKVINGDNYIDCEYMDNPSGSISISTGNGDDIINAEFSLTAKTKSFYVNAGKGDDIISCEIDFDDDESGSSRRPSVSFKGGKGSDIFIGVPGDLTGRVKDFDIKRDSLGFEGDIRKHRFYETSEGLAIVDMRSLDGVLILQGVDSIDQINVINDVDIF